MNEDDILKTARLSGIAMLDNVDPIAGNKEALLKFAELIMEYTLGHSISALIERRVSAERERIAAYFDSMPGCEMFGSTVADEIREMA